MSSSLKGLLNTAAPFLNELCNPLSAPSGYLYAVSRTIELSLQRSFQLSLMVLVRYRIRVIFSLGWSVPPTLDCIPKQSDSK